jgi:spore germination cell wall hydrolase CwlJ-like protein
MTSMHRLGGAIAAGLLAIAGGAALAQSRVADIPAAGAADAETRCLALTVYWESKSESRKGQLAIAHTVLNRVRSRHFPDTVCGVVAQQSDDGRTCQFAWWCDGKRDAPADTAAWRTALAVARQALAGGADPSHHALYFHGAGTRPDWTRRKTRTVRIGNHIFYR